MLYPHLLSAFEKIHYTVHCQPALTVRVGQHSPELDTLLLQHGQDCAAIITAWNPQGFQLDKMANQHRQQGLLDELDARDLTGWPATAQQADSAEPAQDCVMVIGLQFQAASALARSCGQRAFVWADLRQQAEWIEI